MIDLGSWNERLAPLFADERYKKIRSFLIEEYKTHTVYPDMYDLYNCFRFTPFENVKVVLLGQDPYHGTRERKSEKALWLLLLYVFSFTWACPMQIGLSQECCLFYLKSSLWSSDLPLTFLCSIFAGFSLPCLLATTILDSFSLFYLPNSNESAYQCREHGFNPWS